MASSINVKIAPLPRGNYSSSATYAKLDVVSYNGSSYMAIKAVPTGTVPTNTTYWQCLAEKPTIGEGSITTNMLADGAVTADKLDSSVFDKYAEVSGTYEDMVVGSAEQLLSTQYDTDSVPYAFRKSPYGDREFDEIVGGSIAWNQKLRNNNFANTANWSAGTNDTFTVANGVATFRASARYHNLVQSLNNPIGGHVYLGFADVQSYTSTNVYFYMRNVVSGVVVQTASRALPTTKTTVGNAIKLNESGYQLQFMYQDNNSAGWGDITIQNASLVDLTQMFGSTVADAIYAMEQSSSGSGVAFFRGLFPKPYYAYNAGQLISVSGLTEHKTTDENLFVSRNATLNHRLGTEGWIYADDGYFICEMIPVEVGKTYIKNSPTVDALHRFCTYDAQETFVRRVDNSNEITIQEGEALLRFCGQMSEMATTYLCTEVHSYALDSSLTLRGVPKLVDNKVQFDGDIYQSDGTVQRRYGIVTLNGSETWGMNATSHNGYLSMDSVKRVSDYRLSMISSYLPVINQAGDTSTSAMASWVSAYYNNSTNVGKNWIYVHIDGITTAADLKAYLANKPLTLVYELATPTTESAEPYVNPQICNEYGTEEYVSAEQSGVTMIVGHNTKYPQNLRKKIEGLPWNFSNLIAPTEVTNKASRNYTVGSFLIMNNTLYKVTSAIANGGTITVGSNVSATTIMQEILAL